MVAVVGVFLVVYRGLCFYSATAFNDAAFVPVFCLQGDELCLLDWCWDGEVELEYRLGTIEDVSEIVGLIHDAIVEMAFNPQK